MIPEEVNARSEYTENPYLGAMNSLKYSVTTFKPDQETVFNGTVAGLKELK